MIILFFSILAFSCRNSEIKKEKRISTVPEIVNLPAENPFAPSDLSPMDISYFPDGYPLLKLKNNNIAPPVARVIYSRPRKKGREIFGNTPGSICPYGKPWRLGANEATEIEFFRSVTAGGKEIEAGRYSLYCIPYESRWNLRINSDIFTWGLQIDTTLDVMKYDAPVNKSPNLLEEFTMVFLPAGKGMELLIAWDSVNVRLPFTFKQ